MAGPDPSARLHPVDAREIHVHQHEVGFKISDCRQSILGGGHGADHDELVGRFDHRRRGTAKRQLVVDDQHSHR